MDITKVEAACDEVRQARAKLTDLDAKIDEARNFVLGSIDPRKDLIGKLGEANERLDEILGLAIPEANALAAAVTPKLDGELQRQASLQGQGQAKASAQ